MEENVRILFPINQMAVNSPFYPQVYDRDTFWMVENLTIRSANRILRFLDDCVKEMDKEYVVTRTDQDFNDYAWLSGKI